MSSSSRFRGSVVRGLALTALAAATGLGPIAEARAQSAAASAGNAVNEANNPLTPKITLNLQDYFIPSLNRTGGREANQALLRGLVPTNAFGVPQLVRFTLPVVTNPTFPNGTTTALGDLTLFDLAVFPMKGVILGAGPLLVAPTATSRDTGSGRWQAGAAAVAVAPQKWGLLAALATYQHSFGGSEGRARTQLITAQPIVTYNLPDGFYLRSSGTWSFDLENHTSVIPVGLGAGKVWTFGHGNSINAFVEPQYSVFRSGVGVPKWQVFAGVNLQIALGGP